MNPVRLTLARTVLRQSKKARITSSSDILRPCISSFWGNSVAWTSALQDEVHQQLFPEVSRNELADAIIRSSIRQNTLSDDDLFSTLRFLQTQTSIPKVRYVAETRGMEVDIVTGCVNSVDERYVFAYNIILRNVGDRPLRVVCRHYEFRDNLGQIVAQVVAGTKESMGIIGYTPLIEPKAAMLFGSGVSLRTPTGSMSGSFTVCFDHRREDAIENADIADRFPFMKKLLQEKPDEEKFEAVLGPVNFDSRIVAEMF